MNTLYKRLVSFKTFIINGENESLHDDVDA